MKVVGLHKFPPALIGDEITSVNNVTQPAGATLPLEEEEFGFRLLLQLTDVYFLDARRDYSVQQGYILPRIAMMASRLRRHLGDHVTFCAPGDFLAPSCLGKLSAGRHMVEMFKALGVDFVTFGNHEFEPIPPFSASTLADNIKSSKFRWLCANFEPKASALGSLVQTKTIRRYEIIDLTDGLALVLIGVTLPATYPGYGSTTDPVLAAMEVIDEIRRHPRFADGHTAPILLALTHQDRGDDIKLAQECPDGRT
jgi:5'-nucleotidase